MAARVKALKLWNTSLFQHAQYVPGFSLWKNGFEFKIHYIIYNCSPVMIDCWFICNLPPVLENTALAPCFRHSCDLLVSLPSLGLWWATCVHIYISTVYVSVNLSFIFFSFCYPLPHTNLFCVAYIRCKRLYN